jgi:hypothetical protein
VSGPRAETSSTEVDAFAFNVRWTAVTHLGRQFRKLDALEVPTPPDIDTGPGDNAATGNTCAPTVRRLMSGIYLPVIKQMNPECLVRNSEGDQHTP